MRISITFLLFLFSIQAQALENYFSNVFSPIPPGCVTHLPVLQDFNISGTETLVYGTIDVTTLDGGTQKLNVEVWRIGCAVDGRSALLVDFEFEDDQSGPAECMYIPQMGAMLPDGTLKDFRITDEPNSWVDRDDLELICTGESRQFFLDTLTSYAGDYELDKLISAIEYNSAFEIEFRDILGDVFFSQIPAYQNNLGESTQAISGRLSGNWASRGARDQGFLITFGEVANADNMIFVSWFTFDKDGKQLWMVGNISYELGDAAVQVPLEVVSGGAFLGNKVATRTPAGSISLTVKSCNEIEMGYNLSNIGLGQGSDTLVRIASLEIAGYVCADFTTRLIHAGDF